MLPQDYSFQLLLRKYLPQITPSEINRYDGLIALRNRLMMEKVVANKSEKLRDDLISHATSEADSIFKEYKRQIDSIHKLWLSRRLLSLRQGRMLQIPKTPKQAKDLFFATFRYYCCWWMNVPYLLLNRVLHYKGEAVLVVLLLLLLIWLAPYLVLQPRY